MKVLLVEFHSLLDLSHHCGRALESLGQKVKIFYTNEQSLWRHFIQILFPQTQPYHRSQEFQEWINDRLVREYQQFHPDLIFIIKGDDLFPETLKRLKQLGCPKLINWLTDDPFIFQNLVEGFPFYDTVYTFDLWYKSRLEKNGARRVMFLPFACNPDVHKTISLSSKEKEIFGSDICFVGTTHAARIAFLKSLIEFDLAIWGEPFHQSPETEVLQKRYRGRAGQKKMAKIYNASRIALNPQHPQSIEGVNMRTFEAAACGIFQLTDRKKYLVETFEEGKEIICYDDPGEAREMVRYYLTEEEKRIAIARRGQAKVHGQHTYYHRMQQVLKEISARSRGGVGVSL